LTDNYTASLSDKTSSEFIALESKILNAVTTKIMDNVVSSTGIEVNKFSPDTPKGLLVELSVMMNRSRIAEKTETEWDDLVYTKINSVAIQKGYFSDINVDQTKDVSAVYDFCHAGLCKNGANCTNTGSNHTNADY